MNAPGLPLSQFIEKGGRLGQYASTSRKSDRDWLIDEKAYIACLLILWTEVHGIPRNDQVMFIRKIACQSKKDKYEDSLQNVLPVYIVDLHINGP
jgi:hypothetical protein